MEAPLLHGVHHVKIPVTDLDRSSQWYCSRLGYIEGFRFVEDGRAVGVTLDHPNGGPDLALRLNPAASDGLGDFDFFAIGVPDQASIEALGDWLTALGEEHAGVHRATMGWILPLLHDPDGHEVRFYTIAHHTELAAGSEVHNPRESAEARERELNAAR
jgi:catechol 2,3-dioxygenase-like lactoylglutathione lyase family enzyme